jgi:hypothetical protein
MDMRGKAYAGLVGLALLWLPAPSFAEEVRVLSGLQAFEFMGRLDSINPAAATVSIDGQSYRVTPATVVVLDGKVQPLIGMMGRLKAGQAVAYGWYENEHQARVLQKIEMFNDASNATARAGRNGGRP